MPYLSQRRWREVGKVVAPGVTTARLNEVAETFIRDNGAIPGFLDSRVFPAAICTSVNDKPLSTVFRRTMS